MPYFSPTSQFPPQFSSLLGPSMKLEPQWFLDSGPTHYVTNDMSNIVNDVTYSG